MTDNKARKTKKVHKRSYTEREREEKEKFKKLSGSDEIFIYCSRNENF